MKVLNFYQIVALSACMGMYAGSGYALEEATSQDDSHTGSVAARIQFFEAKITEAEAAGSKPELTPEQLQRIADVKAKLAEVIVKAQDWEGLSLEERLKLINDHNPAIASRNEETGQIFDKDGQEIVHGHPDYLDIHGVSPRMLQEQRQALNETGILTPEERASVTAPVEA